MTRQTAAVGGRHPTRLARDACSGPPRRGRSVDCAAWCEAGRIGQELTEQQRVRSKSADRSRLQIPDAEMTRMKQQPEAEVMDNGRDLSLQEPAVGMKRPVRRPITEFPRLMEMMLKGWACQMARSRRAWAVRRMKQE